MKVRLFHCSSIMVLMMFLASLEVHAHAGGHGKGYLREWNFRSHNHHIHASFHSFRSNGDTIILEQANGSLVHISLHELSEHDYHYATAHIEMIKSMNAQGIMLTRLQAGTLGHDDIAFHPASAFSPLQIKIWRFALAGVALAAAFLFLLALGAYHKRSWHLLKGYAAAFAALIAGVVYSGTSQAEIIKVVLGTNPLYMDSTFSAFKPHVTTRWDSTYFYVENNGMPSAMPAMKGISAWQQQVPLPQAYTGTNAWSIPLHPQYATTPISTANALFTGAIAVGVNGLPIFNAKNNRGEYSYDIGELDSFGGHCGRADDYHYHIAPLHLQSIVGKTQPIAWALDGYPLYGESEEPDGTPVQILDANLGHEWQGGYHYHAINTRPYLIAALRGKVTVQNDQIMPQAQTKGVRPFLQPLNGAVITDFHKCDDNHYALKYTVKGKVNWVNYRWDANGNYTFTFVDSTRTTRTENYKKK